MLMFSQYGMHLPRFFATRGMEPFLLLSINNTTHLHDIAHPMLLDHLGKSLRQSEDIHE
jgi:hypothetical protein